MENVKRENSMAWKLFALCVLAHGALAADAFFSFARGEAGGLARIEMDDFTGTILTQEVVFAAAHALPGGKVVQTRDGWAALAINANTPDNLIIRSPKGKIRKLSIPDKLDEIRAHGGRLLIGGEEGGVFLLDLESGTLLRQWMLKDVLRPPGRRPEDVRFDTDGTRAWVSLQKDGKEGKRLGNRVACLDLETGAVLADLQLPRDRPELHFGREGDRRQSGPGPEIVLPFDRPKVLFVTLDLYGAVGIADLDAARRGRLEGWKVLPTALDDSWGTAFPDRAIGFFVGGRDYALVLNSGKGGGAVVVDLAERAIVQRIPVGHGLYSPALVPAAQAIVAAAGGKLKVRGEADVEKTYHPRPEVAVFEIRPENGPLSVRMIPLEAPSHTLRPVAPEETSAVLVNVGADADEWIVLDVKEGRVLDRAPSVGRVIRLAPIP